MTSWAQAEGEGHYGEGCDSEVISWEAHHDDHGSYPPGEGPVDGEEESPVAYEEDPETEADAQLSGDIDAFLARYPVDERARDYMLDSGVLVVQQALRDFKPPREGDDDYSGLLTAYIKKLRQRQLPGGGRPALRQGPRGYSDMSQNHPPAHGSGRATGVPANRDWDRLAFDEQLAHGLDDFILRYPIDKAATDFLCNAPPDLQARVIVEFRPPHEGEDDYSALLTSFLKKCHINARAPPQMGNEASHRQPGPVGGGNAWSGGRGLRPAWELPARQAPPPSEGELEIFLERYPVDQRARDYFGNSLPGVQRQVLREFKPPREGEADYSSIFTTFVRRCRNSGNSLPPQEAAPVPCSQQRVGGKGGSSGGGWGGKGGKGGSCGGSWSSENRGGCEHFGGKGGANGGDRFGGHGGTISQEELDAFRKRYPMDQRAFAYIVESSAEVQKRVVKSFLPPRWDDTDFSAPVTAYVKRCRRRNGEAEHGPANQHVPLRHAPVPERHPVGSGIAFRKAEWDVEPETRLDDVALEHFLERYPCDQRVLDYLRSVGNNIASRVLREFHPKREGEDDYSALVMSFTKRCRDQGGGAGSGAPEPPWKRSRPY